MKQKTCIQYRYLTNEYRIYTCKNGRKYKVFKNGEVVSCCFELTDKVGRKRCYEEKKCIPTLSNTGYFEIFLGGRKGDNCVENIRWLTQKEYTEKYVNCLNSKKNVQIFGGQD